MSDRKDGANVNGWHWEERNMMGWSRDKLTELLVGLVADISPDQGAAELTELKDLKGEVRLWASCQRELVGPALQVILRKGLYAMHRHALCQMSHPYGCAPAGAADPSEVQQEVLHVRPHSDSRLERSLGGRRKQKGEGRGWHLVGGVAVGLALEVAVACWAASSAVCTQGAHGAMGAVPRFCVMHCSGWGVPSGQLLGMLCCANMHLL